MRDGSQLHGDDTLLSLECKTTGQSAYHVKETHEQVRAQRQHRRVQIRIAREVNQRHEGELPRQRRLLDLWREIKNQKHDNINSYELNMES